MSSMRQEIGVERVRGMESRIIGIDEAPDRQPGVPMEREPSPDPGAHWETPVRQVSRRKHFHRMEIEGLTPVFGTAQPPRGVSGLIRRFAYKIPEHKARHWLTLLAADRVDVLEGNLGRALARPIRRTPLSGLADPIEKNPVRALTMASLALIGGTILLRRALD